MNQRIWLIALFVLMIPIATFAQDVRRGDPCHDMRDDRAVDKNFLDFKRFDKELRVALTKQAPVALAFW